MLTATCCSSVALVAYKRGFMPRLHQRNMLRATSNMLLITRNMDHLNGPCSLK